MKSMTIHGIDDQLAALIKEKAAAEGLSVNKTIKKLLEISLGIKPRPPGDNRNHFTEFCGVWSEKDFAEFEDNTADTRNIDPGDWR